MSSPSKQTARYDAIDVEGDITDLGHESDTTACSEGFLSKVPPPQRRSRSSLKRSARSNALVWLRWGVTITLQSAMLLLLVLVYQTQRLPAVSEDVETGSDINGIFKTESHVLMHLTPEQDKYMPNMTSDIDRMEIRNNWNMLMPLGSGSVEIKDWKKYPMLGQPIDDDPARSGSLFEASWTHALHCLYYHVDTYQQMVAHGSDNVELNPAHASHCFEYLRNSIMCNMDMTLEGSTSVAGTKGLGQLHQCRNRVEAIKWIEDRRVDDARDIVGS